MKTSCAEYNWRLDSAAYLYLKSLQSSLLTCHFNHLQCPTTKSPSVYVRFSDNKWHASVNVSLQRRNFRLWKDLVWVCLSFIVSNHTPLRLLVVERDFSKNCCLIYQRSLPAGVLSLLPGGSILLSEGGEALLCEDLSSATSSNLSGQDNPLLD